MFKFEKRRYAYDIGKKQDEPDSSYPIHDPLPSFSIQQEGLVQEGDDISKVTKDTLGSYLKKYSRGKTESLNIHPNDFPIGKEGVNNNFETSFTDEFGYPSKFTPPPSDQKIFTNETNKDGLKSQFFDFGVNSIKETGFRKGLDPAPNSYNGNSLLNNEKNTKFIETRYTNSLLSYNRFTSSRGFSRDFKEKEFPEQPSIPLLTETNIGKTDLGGTQNEYKFLSMDQLSVVGTKLLEGSSLGIDDFGNFLSNGLKVDFSKIDVKKIIADNIINSNEYTESKYQQEDAAINDATYGSSYSDKNIFSDSTVDLSFSSLAIRAIGTIVIGASAALISLIENAISKVETLDLQKNSILNDLGNVAARFFTTNPETFPSIAEVDKKSIEADNYIKDLSNSAKLVFRGGKVFLGATEGFLDALTNFEAPIFHKNTKQLFISIINDIVSRTSRIINLIKNNSSLANILNIIQQVTRIYFESKIRKFSEYLIYIGVLHAESSNRNTFDKDLKKHTIQKSREAGFLRNGNVKSIFGEYRYNNDLISSYIVLDSISEDIREKNSKQVFFTKKPEIENKNVDFETIKEDENSILFCFHDTRTNEILSFHAFLDQLSDGFTTNYDNIESMGRIEPIRTYKDTQRKIEVGFTMFASNADDFDLMWFKVNKLLTMIYPQYTYGREIELGSGDKKFKSKIPFSQIHYGTPIIRLRIGDYIKSNHSDSSVDRLFTDKDGGFIFSDEIEQSPIFKNFKRTSNGLAGVIEGFTFDTQNSPWETDKGRQAPKILKISFGFQPIHDISPGLDHKGINRAPIYKIGALNSQVFLQEKRFAYSLDRANFDTTPIKEFRKNIHTKISDFASGIKKANDIINNDIINNDIINKANDIIKGLEENIKDQKDIYDNQIYDFARNFYSDSALDDLFTPLLTKNLEKDIGNLFEISEIDAEGIAKNDFLFKITDRLYFEIITYFNERYYNLTNTDKILFVRINRLYLSKLKLTEEYKNYFDQEISDKNKGKNIVEKAKNLFNDYKQDYLNILNKIDPSGQWMLETTVGRIFFKEEFKQSTYFNNAKNNAKEYKERIKEYGTITSIENPTSKNIEGLVK